MICLPKEDKLCVCHMCKTRLQTWDSFIDSCKKTQAKLKELLGKDEYADLLGLSEESVGPGETSVNLSLSQPRKKKSSNYCIARWCNNGNYQGISLFRLPKERERALKWLAAADRTDLQGRTVLHSLYLCAKHFTSNMFTNKACNQLIKKAIPTLFPKSPSPNKKLSTAVCYSYFSGSAHTATRSAAKTYTSQGVASEELTNSAYCDSNGKQSKGSYN